MEEKMDIFELTVPLEPNIKNANAQKMNKYEHFITDITTMGMCLFTLLKLAQEDISHHQIRRIQRNCISSANPVLVSKQCVKIYQALLYCHHITFLEKEKH